MARPRPEQMARESSNLADESKPAAGVAGIRPVSSERARALTMSTRFPDDQSGSSAKSLELAPRPDRKRAYFVSSPPSEIGWLKPAAIEFAWAVVLIAGSIMAVLCALDLMDMLRW
jgi:hypothetical protein